MNSRHGPDLDPAIEQRIQSELARPIPEPTELLTHALDLVEAERNPAAPC